MPNTVIKHQERWHSIDLLKGLGVWGMVTIHSLTWWFIYPTYRLPTGAEDFFSISFFVLGALVLFLPITSGVALWFICQRAWNTKSKRYEVVQTGLAKSLLVRLVVLALLGILMNVIAWGFDSALLWNILQFYALAVLTIVTTLAVGGLRAVGVLGIVSLLCAIFAPVLQAIAPSSFLASVLIGNPDDLHIWPLLPWLYVIIGGFFVTEMYDRVQHSYSVQTLWRKFFAVGTVVLLTIILLFPLPSLQLQFTEIWDFSDQPPMSLIIAMLSLFFILLPLTEWGRDIIPAKMRVVLGSLGQAVLPVYLVHMPTAFWYFGVYADGRIESSWLLLGLLMQYSLMLIVAYAWWLYRVIQK